LPDRAADRVVGLFSFLLADLARAGVLGMIDERAAV
jgi:hypothetical protein